MPKVIAAVAAATVFAGLALGAASAGDTGPLAGNWTIRGFYTEDVVSKERHDVYGPRPQGAMQMWPNGRFTAYVRDRDAAPAQSVWEDVANSLAAEPVRAIFYGGTYRIDRESLFLQVDYVRHEGLVGADAFDMSWNEGRTLREDERSFQISTTHDRLTVLVIDTPSQPNPNGAGNTIVGRTVWQRMAD